MVVEVLSPTTRRRDHEHKREFYLRFGIPEYWIVDGKRRTIRIVKSNTDDVLVDRELTWHPAQSSVPLVIDVVRFFRDALGDGPVNDTDD